MPREQAPDKLLWYVHQTRLSRNNVVFPSSTLARHANFRNNVVFRHHKPSVTLPYGLIQLAWHPYDTYCGFFFLPIPPHSHRISICVFGICGAPVNIWTFCVNNKLDAQKVFVFDLTPSFPKGDCHRLAIKLSTSKNACKKVSWAQPNQENY